MPVFLSYAHEDSDFVDKLAMQLVQRRVYIWLDRWELQVGDSLITRIESAITTASALLVILSASSVESDWCKAEINAGLLREMNEKRVVVLPVLIEDCAVPIFLQNKLHADFRSDFDAGLRTVMEAIAGVTNAAMSRTEGGRYYTDWSLDWGETEENLITLRLTFVQHATEASFTVLATIEIIGNDEASDAHRELVRKTSEERAHVSLLDLISGRLESIEETRIVLSDQFEKGVEYLFVDGSSKYYVKTSARRMGTDTGRDVLVAIDEHLVNALEYMKDVMRQPDK
ncbi:toll/interleukin-1 receptor domain-containing protein [Actinomadura sp. GC306]|uniref:toll/interleukin-1 receptor domain-containing protein n=1 Tax=Actinomadura sp. GC306 TaxID=2530367 RepID=UPI0014048FE3|nr:toll/interleukin-1 receptor domain-containing protein [Actinomadura sp. GC306]